MNDGMDKELTVTLSPGCSWAVRDFSRAHNCTYASAVEACVAYALGGGSVKIVLEPFGDEPANEPQQKGCKP